MWIPSDRFSEILSAPETTRRGDARGGPVAPVVLTVAFVTARKSRVNYSAIVDDRVG
jgi:hypothetical protein